MKTMVRSRRLQMFNPPSPDFVSFEAGLDLGLRRRATILRRRCRTVTRRGPRIAGTKMARATEARPRPVVGSDLTEQGTSDCLLKIWSDINPYTSAIAQTCITSIVISILPSLSLSSQPHLVKYKV